MLLSSIEKCLTTILKFPEVLFHENGPIDFPRDYNLVSISVHPIAFTYSLLLKAIVISLRLQGGSHIFFFTVVEGDS